MTTALDARALTGGAARSATTRPVLALARVEGRRLVRHPAFLAFTGLSLAFTGLYVTERRDANVAYELLGGVPTVSIVFGCGVLVAASLAASRSRHDNTDELYRSAPVDATQRTAAQLASLAWAWLVAVGIVGVGAVASGMWNGLPVALLDIVPSHNIDFPRGTVIPTTDVVPSFFELVQGPLAIVVLGVLGVTVARWVGTRLVLLTVPVVLFVQMLVTSWGIHGAWRWFLPFAHSLQQVGWAETNADGTGYAVVQGFNVAAIGWHDLYLVGVILALGCVALAREGRRRAVAIAAALGVALIVVGGVLQVATYTESVGSL